jgi:E3 ubiquitin-protein ligase FANCL
VRWEPDSSSLASVLSQFEAALPRFRELWTVLADWDTHTHVLEPSNASAASTMRRVALGKSRSLSVEVDFRRPWDLCECRFFGPDAAVEPLQRRLREGFHSWDRAAMPRENLERILQLSFPSPKNTQREDFNIECGICYSFHLPPQSLVPDSACDNDKCARSFHRSCLYEWLKSLPTSRHSFDTVFGTCPYCSEPITSTIS